MAKLANPNDEKFWKTTQFREVIIFVPKETS